VSRPVLRGQKIEESGEDAAPLITLRNNYKQRYAYMYTQDIPKYGFEAVRCYLVTGIEGLVTPFTVTIIPASLPHHLPTALLGSFTALASAYIAVIMPTIVVRLDDLPTAHDSPLMT
jgi:hypothetical protein